MIIKKHFLVEFTFDTGTDLSSTPTPILDDVLLNELTDHLVDFPLTSFGYDYELGVEQMVNIP